MSVDREYRIRISTQTDTSGARQQAEALNDLSAKTRQYIRNLQAGADQGEQFEIKERAMRSGLGLLGGAMAEVGHLSLLAMANPATAAFLLIAAALSKVVEEVNKYKEMIGSAPSMEGIAKVLHDVGKDGLVNAFQDAEVAAAKFWKSLEPPNTTAQAVDAEIEKAKAAAKASKDELDAKQKQGAAVIDAQLKAGQIDQESADRQKQALAQRIELQKEHEDQLARNQEIAAKRSGIAVAPSKDAVDAQQRAASEAAATAERTKAELDALQKQQNDVRAWLEKYKGNKNTDKYLEEQGLSRDLDRRIGMLSGPGGEVVSARIKADEEAKKLSDMQGKVAQAGKWTQEIDRAAVLNGIQSRSEAHIRQIGEDAEAAQVAATTGMPFARASLFTRAISGEEGAAHHQQLTQEQAVAVSTLTGWLRVHGQTQAQITQLLRALQANDSSFAAKLQMLEKAITNQGQRIRSGSNSPT